MVERHFCPDFHQTKTFGDALASYVTAEDNLCSASTVGLMSTDSCMRSTGGLFRYFFAVTFYFLSTKERGKFVFFQFPPH